MDGHVRYVDRKSGELVVESVMGDGALKFAYETLSGRLLWPLLFGSKFISALMGRYYDSPRSKKAIRELAAIPGCRADEAEKPLEEYGSFNEFFTRRLKPNARAIGQGFVSPADGRLRLYLNADIDTPFPLKGATKSLRTVFAPPCRTHFASSVGGSHDSPNSSESTNFDIAVIRLAPVDYHRFHFPCDCKVIGDTKVIPGKYHSVNPIALAKYPNVYADNERQIVRCETAFGSAWLVDVGAFGVGTIIQTYEGETHRKGDEKGYFKFGGSTVIVVTKAGAVKWDEDIVKNSEEGLETRVLCGEKVGV